VSVFNGREGYRVKGPLGEGKRAHGAIERVFTDHLSAKNLRDLNLRAGEYLRPIIKGEIRRAKRELKVVILDCMRTGKKKRIHSDEGS